MIPTLLKKMQSKQNAPKICFINSSNTDSKIKEKNTRQFNVKVRSFKKTWNTDSRPIRKWTDGSNIAKLESNISNRPLNSLKIR